MYEKFDDYSLDGLIKEFKRHEENYIKDWPEFADRFSISKALRIICEEIKEIKKETYVKRDETQSRLCEKPHSRCY